jgi:hypothetical protein
MALAFLAQDQGVKEYTIEVFYLPFLTSTIRAFDVNDVLINHELFYKNKIQSTDIEFIGNNSYEKAPPSIELYNNVLNRFTTDQLKEVHLNVRLVILIKEGESLKHEIGFGTRINRFVYNDTIYILNKEILKSYINFLKRSDFNYIVDEIIEYYLTRNANYFDS